MPVPPMLQSGLPGFDTPNDDAVRNVFFALKPNGSVADSILAAANALTSIHHDSAGRALKRHRLHMTLLYIGSYARLPEKIVRNAIEAGDRVVADAFDISLDIAGSFRNRDMPWWLGSSVMPTALATLHDELFTHLLPTSENARGGATFKPHVTISRTNRQVLPEAPIATIRWHVDEFCLLDSVMGEREFRVLKSWTLRDRSNG